MKFHLEANKIFNKIIIKKRTTFEGGEGGGMQQFGLIVFDDPEKRRR